MIKLFDAILLFAVFFFFALSSDFVYAWNSTAEMPEVPDTNASVRRYSDHIKVCQVGYLVDESKIAILTAMRVLRRFLCRLNLWIPTQVTIYG